MYQICYLPLALQDIDEVITYLVEKLFAPNAAETLLNEIDKAVETLRNHPYAYPIYQAKYPLEFEIRKVPVKNFVLVYVVLEDMVEIHRFIYGKRNLAGLSMDGELS